MSSQHWDEQSFCENYSNTWEIAEDEVHYGWLAPGESELRLIDLDLAGAQVLDIGCGMGENLIALARQGALGHGIDISGHMLAQAREKAERYQESIEPIRFQQQDMRQTDFFPGISFDLILSAYSLEYLSSTQELKDIFYNLFKRLKPGGVFIFCFSHQLQHERHNLLFNRSGKVGEFPFAPMIYSFRDVIDCLSAVGYVVERVVEQEVKDPSRLSYEQARLFPYHFHRDQNPCHPQFDNLSNQAPHTVIYKVRKLDSHGLDQGRAVEFNLQKGLVNIWGQNRSITASTVIKKEILDFTAHRVARKDSLVGLCQVAGFTVNKGEMTTQTVKAFDLNINGSVKATPLPANSVQMHVHQHLLDARLLPIYERSHFGVDQTLEFGLYIKRILPLHGPMREAFPQQQLGVLVFINGEEPAQGTIGLEDISVTPGDHIQIFYIATQWGKEWRDRKRRQQLDLF